MPNTFLEKTIESWLIKTNELGYTLPFAEVLVAQGHAVIHISKQNAFEQGKDLISIGPDGTVCGYQLKGGNITDHLWTTVVWPEIEKLRGLPIIHPSIPAGTPHVSVLVTNGYIEDTVRRAITDLNNTRWQDAPLQTIVRGQLVRQFVDASSAFLPTKPADYQAFLELFFADGRGFVNDEKLSRLLEDVLDLENATAATEARKRNIAAAILFGSYAISGAAAAQNYVACIHAIARITGYVFCLVERYAVPKKHWKDSIDLLLGAIADHAHGLESEMLAGRYDDLCREIWDGSLAVFRRSAAFDALTAYKLSQLIRSDAHWSSVPPEQLVPWHMKGLALWGEAAVIGLVLRFLLFCAFASKSERIVDLLAGPLREILQANTPEFGGQPLLSPYFDIEVAVRLATGTLAEPIGESFRGHSFTVGLLVDLLARYDQRSALAELWPQITYISHAEYRPAEKWEWFRRRGKSGSETSDYPPQTMSWAELQRQARTIDVDSLPSMLIEYPQFLPFFAIAYPHHVTRNFVRHLDETVARAISAGAQVGDQQTRSQATPR
ncbi:MAG: hypothetical protein AABO58_18880 [Acidobacteriota bacterium]